MIRPKRRRIESLVKIKRKDSRRVEFLMRKSKKLEKTGISLANKTKGMIKKGEREIKSKSFLRKQMTRPKRLEIKIR
jgi:hypothetical protein